MVLETSLNDLRNQFLGVDDWEERFRLLIELGKKMPEMASEDKIDKYRVKGCQSQVWLKPHLEAGKVCFSADSDAMLVKGIVALLMKIYSHRPPQEILATKDNFLQELGIKDHLSMNRSNGLAAITKQIKMYALAYQTLLEGNHA